MEFECGLHTCIYIFILHPLKFTIPFHLPTAAFKLRGFVRSKHNLGYISFYLSTKKSNLEGSLMTSDQRTKLSWTVATFLPTVVIR
jgi:hypothetical protein